MSDHAYPGDGSELPAELTKLAARIAEQQAPDAAVRRLIEGNTVIPSQPMTPPIGRTVWRRAAIAVSAAAILAYLTLVPSPSNAVLADMKQAMAQVKSIRLVAYMLDGNGKKVSTIKASVLPPSRIRREAADGSVVVADFEQGQAIELKPSTKTAKIYPLYQSDASLSFLNDVVDVMSGKQTARAKEVERTIVDGVETALYEVRLDDSKARILVDLATKLPIKVTVPIGTSGYVVEASQFVFDEPLDPESFSIEAPNDYAVTTLPEQPKRSDSDLAVTHGVGLGPIQVGFTTAEVIEHLGAPDVMWPAVEATQSREVLMYKSRGFQMQISPTRGVVIIACTNGSTFEGTRPFAGHFKKGDVGPIRLGDSYDSVTKLLGKPFRTEGFDAKTKSGNLIYEKLDEPSTTSLDFRNAKLNSISILKLRDAS